MNRTCAVAALVVAATCTTASADSPRLKGSYGFTGTAACLVSPAGFTTDLKVADAGPNSVSFTRSFSVEGVRTFDGHGNGTVKGTAVNITVRPTPQGIAPNASSGDFTFNFTYTVNGDGTWTSTMVPGSFSETIMSGPNAGQTVTMPDGIPPISGLISIDGKTLTAAHLEPKVETRVFSGGGVRPEICHRSRVLIKLQDADDDHDQDHDHDH
jgi:hypothetical protein